MKAPLLVVLVGSGALGCTGVVGEAGGPGKGGSGSGGSGTLPPIACVQGAEAPATRVRRLTKTEIQNSTNAALGAEAMNALGNLEADPSVRNGFSNSDQLVVSDSFANALNLAADAIGTRFKATVTRTAYGATCFGSDAAAETCAGNFIRTFGKKVFRRDVTDDDATALTAVYKAGRDTGTDGDAGDRFASGLAWVVRAMVQSPDFLYRTELGDPDAGDGERTRLLPHEIASAISYSVLGMPPDDTLLAAAAGGLDAGEARAAEAARLIASYPESWKQQMRQFVPQWLNINYSSQDWDKDPEIVPMFSSSMKSALQTETAMFIDDWATAPDGPSVRALLTGNDTFVNQVTGPLYGVSGSGSSFSRMTLPGEQRAGILTMAGFLGTNAHVAESSPVLRGKAIMKRLMCREPPPVPPNVPPLPLLERQAPTTTRARFQAHLVDQSCRDCHSIFEPMGNAFEMYDAIGAYRTEQNGFPVDSSGALVGDDGTTPVANAVELVNLLAGRAEVSQCVARQVFRYTMGREEQAFDGCTLEQATSNLADGASDVRQAVSVIVGSDSFVTRTVRR